jgi:hypothetical protein
LDSRLIQARFGSFWACSPRSGSALDFFWSCSVLALASGFISRSQASVSGCSGVVLGVIGFLGFWAYSGFVLDVFFSEGHRNRWKQTEHKETSRNRSKQKETAENKQKLKETSRNKQRQAEANRNKQKLNNNMC